MNKSKHVIIFSSSIFVLTFAFSLFGAMFNTNMLIGNNNNNNSNLVFAQESVATLANSVSDSNNTIIFNNYENSEVGVSIKYPSNFLIDESNSNETVKQISFFPAYDDDSGLSPETFISWFDVYVQTFYPPIFYSPDNLSSYLEDRTNAIQQEDQDVTIIDTSTDALLAGHPAYKLVTRSYSGNETIDTIEYGVIVDNKLYSLSYEVNTSDYQNSLPIANKMIYSFNIDSDNLSKSLKLLTNSTGLAMLKDKVPMLQGILSSLNSNNVGDNSSKLFNSSEINSSPKIMLENLLKNSSAGTLPNMTSMMNSIPPINLQSICSIELLANLCTGGPFSNPSLNMGNSLLNNESSISGLADILNFPKNSTDDFNLSEFKQLLGPFAMLSSPSSNSSFSSLEPQSSSSSSSSPSSFSDLPFSSFLSSNGTDASFLNQMFRNESKNGTALNDTTIVNPFEALFGGAGNDTGLGFSNNDSFGFDSSNSFMEPNSQGNETLDILRMLEFLQGGSSSGR
ncbi:MAG TPA: PsbP-related protein [Nitrososphaeraceae archaeon]